MKNQLITLAFSATALLATTQITVAQSSDVAQIKAVVERETTAWNNRDATAMADCWANVPEAGNLISTQDDKGTVMSNHNAKMDMPATIKMLVGTMGKPTGVTFQNTDYLIRVKGDAAFAQYEQTETASDGKKEYLHETRYLEKMKGQWKIVHVGAAVYKPTK